MGNQPTLIQKLCTLPLSIDRGRCNDLRRDNSSHKEKNRLGLYPKKIKVSFLLGSILWYKIITPRLMIW